MKKHYEKGTITLEASIVVPVFIILMLLVCGLFIMFMGRQVVTHAVVQAAKSMSYDPYYTERMDRNPQKELNEMFGDLLSINDDYVSVRKWYSDEANKLPSVASNRVKAYLTKNGNQSKVNSMLDTFGVVNGAAGLKFSESKVENGVLTLKVSYKQRFPLDATGLAAFDRSVSVSVRLFTYAELANSVYEVSFNSNGGSMVTNKVTNESNDALPRPSKEGYAFLGWSTDPNAKTPNVKDLETAKKIGEESGGKETLYAVWLPVNSQTTFLPPNAAKGNAGEQVRNDQVLGKGDYYYDTVYTGLDPKVLKENGLSTVKVTIVFDGRRTNSICLNHASVQLYSGGKAVTDTYTYDYTFSKKWVEDMVLTFDFPVSDLASDGSIKIKWSSESAKGSWDSDGWELGTTSVSVTAK